MALQKELVQRVNALLITSDRTTMQLNLEVPDRLVDAAHLSNASFQQEAMNAIAVRMFVQGRLSSGQSAELCGMSRAAFLLQLPQWGVAQIAYPATELGSDIANA